MALPHEYVSQLARYGHLPTLQSKGGLDEVGLRHATTAEAALGESIVTLGLWVDGVPCQWDRNVSVEVCTLNIPGLPKGSPYKQMRLPLVGLLKHQMTSNTWHDLFKVIQWSFAHMASGAFPSSRHDGSQWRGSDRRRARRQGALGYRAVLVQMRADWACWKHVFRMPGWNDRQGCCWRCNTRPDEAPRVGKRTVMEGEGC